MAILNKYASGRAWESVGYTTNGEADDWGWGEENAVSLTIEVRARARCRVASSRTRRRLATQAE